VVITGPEGAMGKVKRVAVYVRVSTDGQMVANQERELAAVADRHGWTVVEVFKDEGISGTRDGHLRPGFARLLQGVARKEFEIVAAWSVDRLGRSLQQLLAFLGELKAKGVTCTSTSRDSIPACLPAGLCSRCLACSRSSSGR
jgi:DNA invertase Pin-like site-specific DNA recombinase